MYIFLIENVDIAMGHVSLLEGTHCYWVLEGFNLSNNGNLNGGACHPSQEITTPYEGIIYQPLTTIIPLLKASNVYFLLTLNPSHLRAWPTPACFMIGDELLGCIVSQGATLQTLEKSTGCLHLPHLSIPRNSGSTGPWTDQGCPENPIENSRIRRPAMNNPYF